MENRESQLISSFVEGLAFSYGEVVSTALSLDGLTMAFISLIPNPSGELEYALFVRNVLTSTISQLYTGGFAGAAAHPSEPGVLLSIHSFLAC